MQKKIFHSTAVFLTIFLAFFAMSKVFVPSQTDFSRASTLGANTDTPKNPEKLSKTHCIDIVDTDQCISSLLERGKERAVLWLGNSQLHEVNQLKSGEVAAPVLLFKKLQHSKLDLMTVSFGNAGFQEKYVIFEYIIGGMPIEMLVLPLVFDDMRENGLRAEVRQLLREERTKRELAESIIGNTILRQNAENDTTNGLKNSTPTNQGEDNLQQLVEGKLNSWLTQKSALWGIREEMRGWLFISLYKLRNFVLGINPSTSRKIIPGRYANNKNALTEILQRAKLKNIKVITYIAPLRNDVKIPYFMDQYTRFKSEMRELSEIYDANFFDLENLVPNEFWGTKSSTSLTDDQELDFMHFQHKGHVLLAEKIFSLLMNLAPRD